MDLCRKYLPSPFRKPAQGSRIYHNYLHNGHTNSYTETRFASASFCFFAQGAAAYKTINVATKTQKSTAQVSKNAPSSGAGPVPVVRDFDKLRAFHSYDPATGKWSTIEGFETVYMLEDTTAQREKTGTFATASGRMMW